MKKLIKCLAVLSLTLFSTVNVFAEETNIASYRVTVENGEATVVEEELFSEVDNSDLFVDVIKEEQGVRTTIYSGTLSGYDNGQWIHMDFSTIQFAVIFDWNESENNVFNEVIYIIPQNNDVSDELFDDGIEEQPITDDDFFDDNMETAENIIDALEEENEPVDLTDDEVTTFVNGEVNVITQLKKRGSTLCISYDMLNLTAKVEPVRVVSAIYRMGKLENMVMGVSKIQSFGGWHPTLEINLPNDLSGVTVKCMVWNEYSMQPYCPAVEITTGINNVENTIETNQTETVNIGERFLFAPKYNGIYSFSQSGLFNIFKNPFGIQNQITNNTPLVYPNTYCIEALSDDIEITNVEGYNTVRPNIMTGFRRFSVVEGNVTYFSDWSKGGIICKEVDGEEFVVCNDKASWLEIGGDYLYYKNLLDNGKVYKVLKTADNIPTGSLAQ